MLPSVRPSFHAVTLAIAAAVSATSCFDSSSSGSSATQPTLVLVAPENFLGSVACLDAAGAAQRYVVTIYDVTPPDDAGADAATDAATDAGTDAGDAGNESPPTEPGDGFALPSSAPVPCTSRAGSSLVVAQHRYAADVQVYDRTDLAPLAAGSPVMVDPAGTFVPPRWTTNCGRTAGDAVTAFSHVTRVLTGCAALTDTVTGGTTTGTVTVNVDPTAAGLTCGTGPGQVATVHASLDGTTTQADGACGDVLSFETLAPGRTVTLHVLGYENGSNVARWGTTCTATPSAGIAVAASCDPLLDGGTVQFNVAALLTAAGIDCSTQISEVSVASSDGAVAKTWSPPDCGAPLALDAVPTGDYTFDLTTTLASGSAGPATTCTASVTPASATIAACQPIP